MRRIRPGSVSAVASTTGAAPVSGNGNCGRILVPAGRSSTGMTGTPRHPVWNSARSKAASSAAFPPRDVTATTARFGHDHGFYGAAAAEELDVAEHAHSAW